MAFKPGDTINLKKMDRVIVTEGELDVFDFVWSIKSFSRHQRTVSSELTSPKTGTKWGAIVNCPGKSSCNTSMHIALQLLETRFDFPVKTTCALHFLNSEMKVHRGYSYGLVFTLNRQRHRTFESDMNLFLEADEGFVSKDGTLNLFLRVTMHAPENSNADHNGEESGAGAVSLATVGQEYKTFLENGEFSDLTLLTRTNSFRASKIFLAGQSKVFKVMFLTEMLESRDSVVRIEDFSDETVQGLLEFIYTGHCESLKENVMEMLKISDKYEVVQLKRECQQILINKLNIENAADMLILANDYNASELKAQVLAFVKICRTEVAETESFKRLKKTHSEALLDLYSSFV